VLGNNKTCGIVSSNALSSQSRFISVSPQEISIRNTARVHGTVCTQTYKHRHTETYRDTHMKDPTEEDEDNKRQIESMFG
jgi:hypothetical protein